MHILLAINYIYVTYDVSRAAFDKLSGDLSQKVDDMTSEFKSLSISHGDVVLSSPDSTSSRLPTFPGLANAKDLPSLDYKDFKHLPYWFEEAYLRRKKTAKIEDDLSDEFTDLEGSDDLQGEDAKPGSSKKKTDATLSCFLEDADGNPLTTAQKSPIFRMIRAYWEFLFEYDRAPATSRKAGLDIKMQFRLLMESNFECLRYCDSHWKVEQLWVAYYPTWLKGALKRAEEEKKKKKLAQDAEADDEVVEVVKGPDVAVIVVDDDNSSKGSTGKRARPDRDETNAPKRPRLAETRTAPPPRPVPAVVTTKRARVRILVSVNYLNC